MKCRLNSTIPYAQVKIPERKVMVAAVKEFTIVVEMFSTMTAAIRCAERMQRSKYYVSIK